MVAAMDNQPGFGNSLDQIGQGYASPPAGSGQPGGQLRSFQDIMRGPGDFRSRLQQFISQGQGPPANPGSDAMIHPANPPATGDNQFGGAPPPQPPPNPPASGGFSSQFP